MVSDEEKEIVRQFKVKAKKNRTMLNFIFPRRFPDFDHLGLNSHSDEYIIRAINLSESKINKYRKSKDHEKRNMCNINAVYHNVDMRISNLEERYTLKKEKLYEIRDYIENYQDYFPEIRSPLANCPKQPIKKFQYSDEDLHHLTRIKDLSRVNWGIAIKKIQKKRERKEIQERNQKRQLDLPITHQRKRKWKGWKRFWNRRKIMKKRKQMRKNSKIILWEQ
jgi:hypothetical protein